MSKYLEKAKELRHPSADSPHNHYNCAQAVLIPFAREAGLEEEVCYAIASNFGGGMKMGGTCGAITGGLMVLGLFGKDSPEVVGEYYRKLKDAHEGQLDCRELLRINHEKGGDKGTHCDDMVYECVELVTELIGKN